MNHPQRKTDPAEKVPPLLEEADIGSGEKTPAQAETEEMIRQIPPLPPSGSPTDARQGGQAPAGTPPQAR